MSFLVREAVRGREAPPFSASQFNPGLGSRAEAGSEAIQIRCGRSGSGDLADAGMRTSRISRGCTAPTGGGGVLTVSEPETYWRTATATPARTESWASAASLSSRALDA